MTLPQLLIVVALLILVVNNYSFIKTMFPKKKS
jgi:hypothetical protein